MADGKVTIDTQLNNKGVESGLKIVTGKLGGLAKTVGKVSMAMVAAFGAAAVAITKQSTEAYADWEQLTGGVETLFGNAADKVKQYAEDAFYTAGMSANEYMETVTGVSASLISSLGGDTEKAADIANMAISDMADNANKMGTPLENVKTAYAGFAKQQYMLLDNLKLGYGGTKTEMERLLKDAEAFSGVKYDINNLGDVYSAIHAIQDKLKITGATAAEAEKTITGSANMTKAAWKNVLTAIAGGGDLDKAINNLVYSVSKYFDNIVPVVQRSLVGMGQLIEKIAPQLVQTVASALIAAIPSLLSAIYQMVIGLAKGIYQGIIALFNGGGVSTAITKQLSNVSSGYSGAASGAKDLAEETEKAGKAAKKSLAGFDELNVLADNAAGGAGDAALPSVGIPSIDTGEVAAMEKTLDGVSSTIFDGFVKSIKKAFNQIRKLFAPTIKEFQDFGAKIGVAIQNALPDFQAGMDGFLSGFRNVGGYVTEQFVPDIVNSFSTNLLPMFGDLSALTISEYGKNFEWLGSLINDVSLNIINPALESIRTIYTDIFSGIGKAWDKHGAPFVSKFQEFTNGIRETLNTLYEQFIKPLWESFRSGIDELWQKYLKPLWDKLTMAVGNISNNLLELWNKVLKPVIDWVLAYLYPRLLDAFNWIKNIFLSVAGYISGVIGGLIDRIDGIIDFITGVFTGDWKKAWEGVRKIFSGIWDSLVAVVKLPLNLIIDGINALLKGIVTGVNTAIKAINKLSFTVPDWVPGIGGEKWGFNIKELTAPQIPKLAQGAVLPANKPFLAMVGDQRHGTNVEAPLTTIQEALALVMQDYNAANLAGHEATVAVLREILEAVLGISIGDDVIANAVARHQTRMAVVRGGQV